jgi:hypothetical protein
MDEEGLAEHEQLNSEQVYASELYGGGCTTSLLQFTHSLKAQVCFNTSLRL